MPAVSEKAKANLKINQARYAKSMRGKFTIQRAQAKARGVAFALTFEQWSNLWLQSGHWDRRGRNPGDYCMSRKNDSGAYALGNIEIVPVDENLATQLVSGAHKSRKLSSQEARQIVVLGKAGVRQKVIADQFGVNSSYVSRLLNGKRGRILMEEK